jgi:hypothetical protein
MHLDVSSTSMNNSCTMLPLIYAYIHTYIHIHKYIHVYTGRHVGECSVNTHRQTQTDTQLTHVGECSVNIHRHIHRQTLS